MAEQTSLPIEELRTRVAEHDWYHTLELAPGVVTPGRFDLRDYVDRYRLPNDLTGQRALDVGTFDGFWAFELERRGAEVVAIDVPRIQDLDWPYRHRPDLEEIRGDRFHLAAAARGSSVRWVGMSIYDADPERLDGAFDLVVCGSLLIHLRDPMLALERIASLCKGTFVLAEEYSRLAERIPRVTLAEFRGGSYYMTWWRPTTRTWMSMVRAAGFENVRHLGRFRLRFRDKRQPAIPHTVIHASGPLTEGQAG
ncbi:MAG: class I SAM-dependent methyltransferase [Solirubrobacterales bacterium]